MKGLEKLTKADLIWLISEIEKHVGGGYAVKHAYNELKFEKAREALKKADECSEKSNECLSRYIEIMRPYEGKRVVSVPADVFHKARKALEERNHFEAEYYKHIREHDRWIEFASEG